MKDPTKFKFKSHGKSKFKMPVEKKKAMTLKET